MTPMKDNNLFGNAYAGSSKLQKENPPPYETDVTYIHLDGFPKRKSP